MIKPKENLKLIKPYKPGRPIEEVQRELGLTDVCKLASNESPFGPSEAVLSAMREAVEKVNLYPDSNCFYLRQELSGRSGVKDTQLIFGNGSDEIIALSIKAFVEPDENIVIASSTFLMYEVYARVCGVGVRKAAMKDFKYDLDALAGQIDKKTKIVFIANPDNPNGRYCTKIEIEDFMKKVPASVLVFLDEAYFEFMPDDGPDSSDLLFRFDNLLYSRTFSKAYGLAGLRIGYGVASEEIIAQMARVKDPFNINSVAQAAALAALKDNNGLRRVIEHTRKEKEFIYSKLNELGLDYVESATNFILLNTAKDAAYITAELTEQGVIVRDMSGWGYDGFIRVSVGTRQQDEKFILCLKNLL